MSEVISKVGEKYKIFMRMKSQKYRFLQSLLQNVYFTETHKIYWERS
jgi:hypothetical protein